MESRLRIWQWIRCSYRIYRCDCIVVRVELRCEEVWSILSTVQNPSALVAENFRKLPRTASGCRTKYSTGNTGMRRDAQWPNLVQPHENNTRQRLTMTTSNTITSRLVNLHRCGGLDTGSDCISFVTFRGLALIGRYTRVWQAARLPHSLQAFELTVLF